MNTPDEVGFWSAKYPVYYDIDYYDPYIAQAKNGDIDSLRKVTEWKNPKNSDPLYPLLPWADTKEISFKKFLKGLPSYMKEEGREKLRADFAKSAPVWSIFWHHVLFGTPIFDVHTNRAFCYFKTGKLLKGRDADIPLGDHWKLYDCYSAWFTNSLSYLQTQAPSITARQLDRALFMWGQAHKNGAPADLGIKPDKIFKDCETGKAPRERKENPIYLKEIDRNGALHRHALRIVSQCGSSWNLGAICYAHNRLDLQRPGGKGGRYLIGEIAVQGGSFRGLPGFRGAINGATCCWAGSAYEGGCEFDSIEDAVRYLKQYFDMRACRVNGTYTDAWIAAL